MLARLFKRIPFSIAGLLSRNYRTIIVIFLVASLFVSVIWVIQRLGEAQQSQSLPYLFMLPVTLILLILWLIPKWHVASTPGDWKSPKDRIEEENKSRAVLAQILGGIAILTGLYFGWQEMELARNSQLTDRFTAAVNQLGSNNTSVQVGGVYALENILKDSPKRYRQVILDALSAHIRKNVPVIKVEDGQNNVVTTHPVSEDVQAAITVIGRRNYITGKVVWDDKIGIYVESNKTIEEDALFFRIPLKDIEELAVAYRETLIANSEKIIPTIQDTKKQIKQFYELKCNLAEIDLSEANMIRGDFRDFYFLRTYFQNASLDCADCSGAVFFDSHLEGTNLNKTNFTNAYLNNAIFSNMTSFLRTDFTGTVVMGAHFEGCNLSQTNITQEQIDSAICDENTRLPDGLVWKGQKPNTQD